MTTRRQKVLVELVANGGKVRLAEVARRCGLHDYRSARRIIKDLRTMGHV